MQRPILTCVLFVFASVALGAQQSTSPDPYQGVSTPPPDSSITAAPPSDPAQPIAKPAAGKPLTPPPAPAKSLAPAQPTSVDPSANFPAADAQDTGDNGTVRVAPDSSEPADAPALRTRQLASDPDGDIVHPHPLGPNTLQDGVTIRVHLETLLSTADSKPGDSFRSTVASDVLQGENVLIPTGSEIDGRVVEVSSGTAGGHGTMRLRPETVVLPDGHRFKMDAQVTGTPGTNTSVTGEGVINAGSRYKKDGIEYGGAVGGGAITGAVLGGPVGALAGSLIGAGAITVHLMMDHPQAVLEPGTVLLFTLTDPLNLVATNPSSAN